MPRPSRPGSPTALEQAPLDLRQGPFARRRDWRVAPARARRLAVLAAALLLVSLAVQVAAIARYSFAADSAEAETRRIAAAALPRSPGVADPQAALTQRLAELRGGGAGFGATAGALFEAVKATPNVELTALAFAPDGLLRATVQADTPAAIEALRQRVEASGFAAEAGAAAVRRRPPGRRSHGAAAMSARLKALWLARTPRERWLLGVMLALVALVLVWLLDPSAARRHAVGGAASGTARRSRRWPRPGRRRRRSRRWRGTGRRRSRDPIDAGRRRRRVGRRLPAFRRFSRKGRGGCRSPSAPPSRRRCSAGSRQLEAQGFIVERLSASSNPDRTLSAQIVLRARGG